jgi:hypothetical protein
LIFFFSISSINICFIIFLICFLRFAFNSVTLISWPELQIWKISPSRFQSFFNAFFFKYFVRYFFFCFSIYGIIPISCSRSCIWFVDLDCLSDLLKAFFFLFLYLSIISTDAYSLHFKFSLSYLKLFPPNLTLCLDRV